MIERGHKPIIVELPEKVISNTPSFEFFAMLAGQTLGLTNAVIVLDFKKCKWFDGNLCAVLGNIIDGLVLRGNSIRLFNLPNNVKTTFSRNKFLRIFSDQVDSLDSLTIPYEKFKLQDEQRAMEFMRTQLFDKPDMPKLSDEAKKAILVSVFEVCVNAITHGQCENVYVCGQIFPNRNPPEVLITFVDLGRTIKANVHEYLKDYVLSGNGTILWALEEGNTTKSGSEPGGIGLKLLQNLINLNQGGLQIVSANGFIELKNGIFIERHMTENFPGTIVTIKLRLGDDNQYVLSTEVDTENIF